ncbi:unnamed protein product [Discula destructiva]
MQLQILFTLLVSTVQATRVLVPLYLDPSQNVKIANTAWYNIYTAVSQNPNTQFQIIINPNNGPGNSKAGYNSDYIAGVAKLNAYPNVHTFGYVHTLYGARSTASVSTDIARWANWNTYTAKDISIKGIFFDEVPNRTQKGNTDVAYMGTLQSYAKQQFNKTSSFQTIYNVGYLSAHPEYFTNMADFVCVFEDVASEFSTIIAASRVPTGKAAQSCMLLIDYVASGQPISNVQSWLQYIVAAGIGSANILDYGYDQANTADAPADLGTVAKLLSS